MSGALPCAFVGSVPITGHSTRGPQRTLHHAIFHCPKRGTGSDCRQTGARRIEIQALEEVTFRANSAVSILPGLVARGGGEGGGLWADQSDVNVHDDRRRRRSIYS